jgi:adenosine deaminase
MDIAEFARSLPKIELHLHLEGSVAAGTFRELAAKHGVPLPPHTAPEDLYRYGDLQEFLAVYGLVCRTMRDADDFRRVGYEALASCARSGARHVEMFFSPHAHFGDGVAYGTMLDGLEAAIADAGADHGLSCRLIPAHSRELGPAAGEDFLDMVLADLRESVIGIGLDYYERPHPPAPFAEMYARAKRSGLRVTAHAGEDGPASYVRDSLDLLGAERIDHGYHVVDDPALVARCREDGVFFTTCPSTTQVTTVWRDLADPDHAIRRMIDAGLRVTINSDDPPMFGTDLATEYARLAAEMGLTAGQLGACALAAIDASWLDESEKRDLRASWSAEIAALARALDDDDAPEAATTIGSTP